MASLRVSHGAAPSRSLDETSALCGPSEGLVPSSDVSNAEPPPTGTPTRLYKVWPSKNRFFCGGRLMTGGATQTLTEVCVMTSCGPQASYIPSVTGLGTWAVVCTLCGFYFVYVFPHLLRNGCVLLPVATLVTFLACAGCFVAAHFSDPGIIPRHEVIVATQSADKIQRALGYDPLGSECKRGSLGRIVLTPQLRAAGYTYCSTCRIVCPKQAEHCDDCDNCVLGPTSHSTLFGNCIGARNSHFSGGFTVSGVGLLVLALPALLWHLVMSGVDDGAESTSWTVVRWLIGACAFLVVLALVAMFVAKLSTLHNHRSRTSRSITEYLRMGAHSVGLLSTTPVPPRLFNPRAMVDPLELVRLSGE